jgi:hypothetical protein
MRRSNMIYLKSVVFIFALWITGSRGTMASAQEYSRELLDGIQSVHVQVARSIPGGLDSDELQGEIERALGDARIKVLSADEYGKFRMSKGYPFARLDVTIAEDTVKAGGGPLTLYRIEVRVRQKVMLDRNATIKLMADTWERRAFAVNAGPEEIKGQISAFVEEFLSDLKAANR